MVDFLLQKYVFLWLVLAFVVPVLAQPLRYRTWFYHPKLAGGLIGGPTLPRQRLRLLKPARRFGIAFALPSQGRWQNGLGGRCRGHAYH